MLALLEGDLTRDMRIAARSIGGRVEPAVRLALTVKMLSGASYLDMMMLSRVASSTVSDTFHNTDSS
jgi:hypothetical protein